jgi:hypothetical protein
MAYDFLEFEIVLPQVSQLVRCPCLPVLGRVLLFYHLPYPAGAVNSLKEVILLLVLQLLPVKVSLCEVRHQSDLGVGSIGNVSKEIIDLAHEIRLVLGGVVPSSDLHCFLYKYNRAIVEALPAELR